MSEFQDHPANDIADASGPEGLLFTGDVIRSLTPEQIATIGEFANRMFGVEMLAVQDVGQELHSRALPEQGETEPEAVPMTRHDFREFAERHGFSKELAAGGWHRVAEAWRADNRQQIFWDREPYPHIRAIDPDFGEDEHRLGYHAVIDLGSVRDRLAALPGPSFWPAMRRTSRPIMFLRALVNHRFPEEPSV